MTPEERQVITGIFERLQAAENHPRDPEAERLIADLVARQPYAPYAMAQSVYVNEQAVANLNRRVEELQAQLQEAQARPQPQSGGFLSSLFGGSKPEPAPQPRPSARYPEPQPGYGQPQPGYQQGGQQPGPGYQQGAPGYPPQGGPGYQQGGPGYPQGGPWGGQPQAAGWGGQAQPQGGGFLQNALTTAAGVAGGMVVGNMLTNAFSHHGTSALASGFGSETGATQSGADSAFGGAKAEAATDTSSTQGSPWGQASAGADNSGFQDSFAVRDGQGRDGVSGQDPSERGGGSSFFDRDSPDRSSHDSDNAPIDDQPPFDNPGGFGDNSDDV